MRLKEDLIYLYPFIVALIPVFWVGKGQILAGGDDNIFLNPAGYITFSSWSTSGFASTFNLGYSRIFPFGAFWIFFQRLGVENWLIQKLWLYSMWLAAALSIIYLVKVLFPKNCRFISFFSVTLYLLNPYNVFIPLTVALRYVHSFLPLILAFFIQGLRSEDPRRKILYGFLFGFGTVLGAGAFSNAANGAILILAPAVYLAFHLLFVDRRNVKGSLLFFLGCLFMFLGFNAFWIWSLFSVAGSSIAGFISSHNWGFFGTSSLFDALRTLGGWAFAKDPYTVFEHSYYQSLGIVFASYYFVIIAFSSALFMKRRKEVLFLFILLLSGLFLLKGTLNPWGGIYQYFFDKISLFKVFREPWSKFTPIYTLSISLLFGWSVCEIFTRLKSKISMYSFIFPLFSFLMISVSGYPALLGVNFWKINFPGQKSSVVEVPKYWNDMVAFFNKTDPDSVVYITPRNFSARDYNWKSGISGLTPFEYLFIKNPIRYSNFTLVTQDNIYNGQFLVGGNYDVLNSPDFVNYLNMLGVRYIIQENDVMWGPGSDGNYPPKLMRDLLSRNPYVERFRTFGNIDIYKVRDESYRPLLYASRKVVITNGPAFSFSSWKRLEPDNFSLVSLLRGINDLDEKERSFSFAYQYVVDGKSFENLSPDEHSYSVSIKESGMYDVYINFIDNKPTLFMPVAYSVDSSVFKPAKPTDNYSEVSKRYLSYLKTPDNFVTEYLGTENFSSGTHNLVLKSSEFTKRDNTLSIFYVALNKRFEGASPKLPALNFEKIKDTRYLVKIENGDPPYILNFSQDFSLGWNLYVRKNGEDVLITPPHFVVNGINNGWYINPKDLGLPETYEIVLDFGAQKVFYAVLVMSITLFPATFAYTMFKFGGSFLRRND